MRHAAQQVQGERRGLGLTGRLILVTGGVFLTFVAGLAVLSLRHFRLLHEATIGQQQLLLARTVAGEVEARFQGARAALEATARVVPAGATTDGRAAQRFIDARLVLKQVFAEGLWLLDGQGRVLGAADPAGPAPPGAAGPDSGKASFSRPAASLRLGGRPAIWISVPVRGPGGAPEGRVVGGLDVAGDGVLARLGRLRIGQEGYFSVFSPERMTLAHRDEARVPGAPVPVGSNAILERALQGFEGWERTRDEAGVEMVSAVQRVPSTGWIVVASFPAAEADRPYLAARSWYGLATLAGAVVLLALAWATARGVTRPLAAMTRQVEALTAGAEVRPLASGTGRRPSATWSGARGNSSAVALWAVSMARRAAGAAPSRSALPRSMA